MGNRGYIGSITSISTPVVLAKPAPTPSISPRYRIEGENSTFKPSVSATNTDTTARAGYIGAVQTSAPLTTTLTVSLPTGTNPFLVRGRLRGENSTIKPVVLNTVIQGIPKNRLYLGSMLSASTVVLLNSINTVPTVNNSKLRVLLNGENSTFKPTPIVTSTPNPTNKRVYFGAMETSAPLSTVIEQTVQSILSVSATHARLTGENSTVKPLVTNMADILPHEPRIYIGGDFFTGNVSGGFIEWDPTTLTQLALKDCRRFWGVSTATSITGAEMQALSGNAKVHSDTHNIIYNVTGGYLYYAHPQPLGTPIIYVNGFMNTAWITSLVLVLENGVYVTYVIYRSVYRQNGNNITLKIDLPL